MNKKVKLSVWEKELIKQSLKQAHERSLTIPFKDCEVCQGIIKKIKGG